MAAIGVLAATLAPSTAVAGTVYQSAGIGTASNLFDGSEFTYATATFGYSPQYCPAGFTFIGSQCVHVASGTFFKNFAHVGIDAYDFGIWQGIVELDVHVARHCKNLYDPALQFPESHLYVWKPGSGTWEHLATFSSSAWCRTLVVPGVTFAGPQSEIEFVIARSSQSGAATNNWGEITGVVTQIGGSIP